MGQTYPFASYDLVASKLIRATPCSVVNIDGNYAGSGGEYFQVFDTVAAPVANDIPIKSMLLSAAGPLPSLFDVLGPTNLVNGLGFGISTVNEKYTASASAYDVFGSIEASELTPYLNAAGTANTGFIIAGDLTTNRQNLTVWNTLARRLCRLEVTTPANGPWYAMIFFGIVAEGLPPNWTSRALVASTAYVFDFGQAGLLAMAHDAGLNYTNCTVIISDQAGVALYTVDNHKIRAIYRNA